MPGGRVTLQKRRGNIYYYMGGNASCAIRTERYATVGDVIFHSTLDIPLRLIVIYSDCTAGSWKREYVEENSTLEIFLNG